MNHSFHLLRWFLPVLPPLLLPSPLCHPLAPPVLRVQRIHWLHSVRSFPLVLLAPLLPLVPSRLWVLAAPVIQLLPLVPLRLWVLAAPVVQLRLWVLAALAGS